MRFIIFSAGKDVSKFVEQHMKSVASQTYKNFIHLIVDDNSSDNTWGRISCHMHPRCTAFRRERHGKGWLANAVQYLVKPHIQDEQDIIVVVDLDDWLVHSQVLEEIAHVYKEKDAWATYGCPVRTDGVDDTPCGPYKKNVIKSRGYRAEKIWLFRAPRTFKVFLWNAIQVEDLKTQDGEYALSAYDFAIGFPLLEMCPPEKLQYISSPMYVYNIHPKNDKIIGYDLQKSMGNYFKAKLAYEPYKYVCKHVNHRFIVFSCGYNCSPWIEQHMKSISNQTYENFVHVLVDDASTDDTTHRIKNFAKRNTFFYTNEKNLKWLANSVKYLDRHIESENDIIVVVDMDDWLAHSGVLTRLNEVYNRKGCWITYGTFQSSDGGRIRPEHGENKFMHKRAFQKAAWAQTHLKTFKAFLWQHIDKQDFKVDGEYAPCNYDRALMYPMMFMTPTEKIRWLPDIVYILNVKNPLRTKVINREQSLRMHKHFTSKDYSHYKKLKRQEADYRVRIH